MEIKIVISDQDLDFIAERLTAGQMDFKTAKRADLLISRMVQQANNGELQKALTTSPANALAALPQEALQAALAAAGFSPPASQSCGSSAPSAPEPSEDPAPSGTTDQPPA
jgi:hypothetical protein